MKIKLLNDGGFHELKNIEFPKEVEASRWGDCGYTVRESEFNIETEGVPFVFLDSEVEVLP